jgi:hypothetical protein
MVKLSCFAAFGLLRQQGSFALFQSNDLVGFQIFEGFFSSTRPENFDTLDFRRGAGPKMQAHVILRDLTFSRRQTLTRYGGGFLRSAPSLISRRRDFPGAPPGSFYPFQQVLPCFLDIDCCVDVSVVVNPTRWTVPFAHSQR